MPFISQKRRLHLGIVLKFDVFVESDAILVCCKTVYVAYKAYCLEVVFICLSQRTDQCKSYTHSK